jgi:hypothetical protein
MLDLFEKIVKMEWDKFSIIKVSFYSRQFGKMTNWLVKSNDLFYSYYLHFNFLILSIKCKSF